MGFDLCLSDTSTDSFNDMHFGLVNNLCCEEKCLSYEDASQSVMRMIEMYVMQINRITAHIPVFAHIQTHCIIH